MADFFKEHGFVVGALTGSLASYLLGLLVSHFRREKRLLGFAIDSRNIVRASHSDLSMAFKGQSINILDSHTVLLKNVGNRPLTNVPVRIVADQAALILEQTTKSPDGVSITAERQNGAEFSFVIDLLNQQETVIFGFTVSDSVTGKLKLISRMEGVQLVDLNDKSISISAKLGATSLFLYDNIPSNLLR